MNNKRTRVLLIEDEGIDQVTFERYAKQQNWPFDYKIAGNLQTAKELLNSNEFDIVISDYKLPDGDAMEILEMKLPIPVIITTGAGSENVAVQTMRAGASDYLIKDHKQMYLQLLPTTVKLVLQRRESDRLIAMLSQAVKSISDGVCILNMQDEIVFVNEALCLMTGFTEDELLHFKGAKLQIEGVQTWNKSSFCGPQELLQQRKNGTTFPVIKTHSLVTIRQGEEIAAVTTIKDVTPWKDAEEKTLRNAEQLARTESELEQLNIFSFVSTHDLQEPLHKILTFNNLLKTDTLVTINAQGMSYLDKISSAVEELRQLIAQLHNYSKIVTGGETFKEVNLNEVASEVLGDLKGDIKSSNAKIEIEKLPIVKADRGQMHIMLYNLLKNALIFRDKSKPPIISIKAEEHDCKVTVIIVEDQGIGFDEKHLKKMFQPFQRLHSSHDYPGRGLGLAICQRILLRHGGKITAKSEVGKGSKFIVTLPLNRSN